MKNITFSYIKDGATKKSGEILNIIQNNGFTILALKPYCFTEGHAKMFYHEHKGKSFYEKLIQFTVGESELPPSVIAMILSSPDTTIDSFRKLIGATDPNKAYVGSIRQLFGDPKRYANGEPTNAIHGSDSRESAIREIKLIFPEFVFDEED